MKAFLTLLGLCLLNGLLLAAEPTAAELKAFLGTKAKADQGDATAQYNLGLMYANGTGVAKDEAEAVKWFRKAADQGIARAQHNLGVMYANGQGVVKDEVEAVKWYRKAADQGLAEAQNNLNVILRAQAKNVSWKEEVGAGLGLCLAGLLAAWARKRSRF